MSSMVAYPGSYVSYLAEYYGSRDFFECHEIMEEYWKEQAGTRYEGCWLVFIRLSVACYHARRGNWAGARKMMAKAAHETDPDLMSELGMNGNTLAETLRRTSEDWNGSDHPVYRDIELPFADPALEHTSRRECRRRGWLWGTPLGQVHPDIIQRHLTRDRTRVVEARRLAAEQKRRSREKQTR